ncbi:MAG: carbamoyl-phosphate synthase large subunit [Synergistes jonesii]|uniref:carbamoyl-phosphate synthase large subunit n=1 Tax=Synergistes jonesii TaxID=2754 RepID=UPI002A74F32B|nr:carbamoyl-phosphate synthase large subunit [Synergistes jonesii]MDY2984936.1 carbamoyl-phosphate synthase large subunit [Synergistes jonesii]
MRDAAIKTVLVLGSGPIKIGQAAEFDYAGTQACRALKEEGCRVILLNSNPATIQTDDSVADRVYIRPLLPQVVEEILSEHRPDGVVATLGGQTGLNLCMECERQGMWRRHKCRVLGTQPAAIERAEAREPFRRAMLGAGQPIIASRGISSVAEAQEFALLNPLPLILRPDFTLGGSGNSVVRNIESLVVQTEDALAASPAGRALIERYLEGWHEIEVEVVRDGEGNALAVCGMENIDPMGVHTGDSVVVSPTLTLTDKEWQTLRSAALKIVDVLDIRGACNVQFALAADGSEYDVIEVNPRASRSSALASKATGYPIARMAAKIALGLNLTEMPNPVTGAGSALSEPALDYVAVKVPSWPFDSFPQADPSLGPRMKATGEVLAIGANFAQGIMKAYRSLSRGHALPERAMRSWETRRLWEQVNAPTDLRLEAITELLRRSSSTVEEIARKTNIRRYFIEQLNAIQLAEKYLEEDGAVNGNVASAAKKGFTVSQIARAADISREEALRIIEEEKCTTGYREVDGCAGEFPSGSGYYYGAAGTGDDPREHKGGGIAVIGSGAIRIAQGVEFDYCCVKAVEALRRRGVRAIMINVNPETVSTDHDISDALYLEPLTADDVTPVLEREEARGVFACFGGQTSLRLGLDLSERGVKLFGPDAEVIEAAEDRGKFSRLLAKMGLPEPEGVDVASVEEAREVGRRLGYPLMVRPSFVIGGVAMKAVYNEEALAAVLCEAFDAVPGQKVMLDRFIAGREFECDAVCDGEDVLIPGIFEHIDPSGIHSGDSIAVFPSFSLTQEQRNGVLDFVKAISKELDVRGLLNVQFVLSGGAFWIIEANPRASRTVPIASKISKLPVVDMAVGVALGERLRDMPYGVGLYGGVRQFGVKVPVFSNDKLPGLDPKLGPRMMSTGESLGIAENLADAIMDGLKGSGWTPPAAGRLLMSVADSEKADAMPVASQYKMLGWEIDATEGTAAYLKKWGVEVNPVGRGELVKQLRAGQWDLVLNIPGGSERHITDGSAIRKHACAVGIPCLHSIAAAWAVAAGLGKEERQL